MLYPSVLDARVAAENRVNAAALEHWPAIVEALRPFLNTKIKNVGGELSAKVKKALPQDIGTGILHAYYDSSDYNIRVNFRVSLSYEGRAGQMACYAERTVYLGEVAGGVLTKLEEAQTTLRTDYTAAHVRTTREELKAAKAVVSEIEGRLFPFGEYDR